MLFAFFSFFSLFLRFFVVCGVVWQIPALLEWMNGVLLRAGNTSAEYTSLEQLKTGVGIADLCSALADGRPVGNIWRDSTSTLCHNENATLAIRFAQTVLRIRCKPPFVPNGSSFFFFFFFFFFFTP